MTKTSSYTSKDICHELRRRRTNGEDCMQYYFIGGVTTTYRGRGSFGPRNDGSQCRKGSQRYLALRNLITTEDLMREIQSRVVSGNKTAWFEWHACTIKNPYPKRYQK